MTCIVGIAKDGCVWIGGDSAGVSGHQLTIRRDPKVFRVGELLIGFTSSFRMGQALMFGWTPPRLTDRDDLFAWMCTEFIDSVRARFGAAGFRHTEHGVERGGEFLVGVRGRLFCVEGDFQVREAVSGFDAVGCGEDIARGVLYYATNFLNRDGRENPEEDLFRALSAASALSGWVSAPFRVLRIPEQDGEDTP